MNSIGKMSSISRGVENVISRLYYYKANDSHGNLFNDNIVKRLVVGTSVVDYYLTTNDYHILPHFALFCVVCHIMQKLCDFGKVRKTLQNTANHGILGGKIL